MRGLKIHEVGASGEAVFLRQSVGFVQHADRDAKGIVALLRPGYGLKDEADRDTCLQALHLGGDMGQDTILRRDVPPLNHLVGHVE